MHALWRRYSETFLESDGRQAGTKNQKLIIDVPVPMRLRPNPTSDEFWGSRYSFSPLMASRSQVRTSNRNIYICKERKDGNVDPERCSAAVYMRRLCTSSMRQSHEFLIRCPAKAAALRNIPYHSHNLEEVAHASCNDGSWHQHHASLQPFAKERFLQDYRN
jgi:hypothetical protein